MKKYIKTRARQQGSAGLQLHAKGKAQKFTLLSFRKSLCGLVTRCLQYRLAPKAIRPGARKRKHKMEEINYERHLQHISF
jgi:hypothetical protein